MVEQLGDAYARKGYKRGIVATKKMLSILTEKSIIIKNKNGYTYNSDFSNLRKEV